MTFKQCDSPVGPMRPVGAFTETDLERRFPFIPWRSPLPARRPDGISGLACRFCIALRGLKAREIGALPQTESEFERHMREAHTEMAQ